MTISTTTLRAKIRIALDDTTIPYTYADSEIDEMAQEGLLAYTAVLPIPYQSVLDDWTVITIPETPDGTTYHVNVLADNLMRITAVYFNPTGDGAHLYDNAQNRIPPEYHYTRLDYRHPEFLSGRYYDIIAGQITGSNSKGIIIGTGVPEEGYIAVDFLGAGKIYSQSIPIPDQHIPILTNYVVAAFARRRAFTEATTGTGDSVYQIGQAARDATAQYNRLLAQAMSNPPAYIPQATTAVFTPPTKTNKQRWS